MPDTSLTSKNRWVTPLALLAVVVILVVSLLVGSHYGSFQGTDDAATAAAAQNGSRSWFHPIFAPRSTEVQMGLFALQAALGGGVLGFALGRLSKRHPRPDTPEDAACD